MTYRELARKLERLGCQLRRRGKGSHMIWANPRTGKKASIPDWGSKDLKIGTVRAVLRQLEIGREEFEDA